MNKKNRKARQGENCDADVAHIKIVITTIENSEKQSITRSIGNLAKIQ